MIGIFSSLAATALLALSQRAGGDPRAAVHAALRAVEGDSVPAVHGRWSERLRRDAGDRAAKLDGVRHGASPAEWAAFAVVGDPLVTVPLTRPAPRQWWPAGATIALAVVMPEMAVYARRRRAPAAKSGEQSRTV